MRYGLALAAVKTVARVELAPDDRGPARDLLTRKVVVHALRIRDRTPGRDAIITAPGRAAERNSVERKIPESLLGQAGGQGRADRVTAPVELVCVDALEPDPGAVGAAHRVAVMHRHHPTGEVLPGRDQRQ